MEYVYFLVRKKVQTFQNVEVGFIDDGWFEEKKGTQGRGGMINNIPQLGELSLNIFPVHLISASNPDMSSIREKFDFRG